MVDGKKLFGQFGVLSRSLTVAFASTTGYREVPNFNVVAVALRAGTGLRGDQVCAIQNDAKLLHCHTRTL